MSYITQTEESARRCLSTNESIGVPPWPNYSPENKDQMTLCSCYLVFGSVRYPFRQGQYILIKIFSSVLAVTSRISDSGNRLTNSGSHRWMQS
jgi:hypothetical protein